MIQFDNSALNIDFQTQTSVKQTNNCDVTSKVCHNTIGSFGCACKEGYFEDGEDKCTGNTSSALNCNTQIGRAHV